MAEILPPNNFQGTIERGIPLVQLEQDLRPYGSSQVGFMGENEKLLDIVWQDLLKVEKHRTTHAVIATALEGLFSRWDERLKHGRELELRSDDMGSRGWGVRFDLPNEDFVYISAVVQTAGNQHCPWYDGAHGQMAGIIIPTNHTRMESKIAQLATAGFSYSEMVHEDDGQQEREEINSAIKKQKANPFFVPLTSLLPHLIREHYFFEGHGTPFRADPEIIIRAFMLEGKE